MTPQKRDSVKHWAGHAVALFVGGLRWIHHPGNATFDDIKFNLQIAERAADIGFDALNETGDYAPRA